MIDIVLYALKEIVTYDLPNHRFELCIVAGGKSFVGTLVPPAEFIKQANKSFADALPEPAKKWQSKNMKARADLMWNLKILPEHHSHIFLKNVMIETQAVPWVAIPYDSITTWSLLGNTKDRKVTAAKQRRP